MPPPPQQHPPRSFNALHKAAGLGSTRNTQALLSKGSFDVNLGGEDGSTPLILASWIGCSGVVRALLDAGADSSIAEDDGITPLYAAASFGSVPVIKMLLEAGAPLEAANCQGGTSLHMAAEEGHSAVISALVQAGAKTGTRRWDGATPLYLAARNGHTETVRVLLRARADPLLAFTNQESGATYVPLDTAAIFGHSDVARELLRHAGIRGCGGVSGGRNAFRIASMHQRLDMMAMLADAGVVDTGEALIDAAHHGQEAAAKFLVKRFGRPVATKSGRAYVDAPDERGRTPLMLSIVACVPRSPRIVRLLIDAGANASASIRIETERVMAVVTPLAYTTHRLYQDKAGGETATEQQRRTLEAIRDLLLREEAIHAISWAWPRVAPSAARAVEGSGRTETPSTSLGMMLPILRRRNDSRRRTLLRTMFRCVVAHCCVTFAISAVPYDMRLFVGFMASLMMQL